MGRTSTASKEKYNNHTYARYTIRVRKDSMLYYDIEEFMSKKGTSLNHIVVELLTDYFLERYYATLDMARTKCQQSPESN